MAMMIYATVSLLLGVTTGGVLQPWNSPKTIVSLILGVLGYVAFVIFEGFYAKAPAMPSRIFASRTAASAYSSTFVHGYIV